MVRTGRERRAVSAVSSGPPHAKTMNAPGKLRKIFAGARYLRYPARARESTPVVPSDRGLVVDGLRRASHARGAKTGRKYLKEIRAVPPE